MTAITMSLTSASVAKSTLETPDTTPVRFGSISLRSQPVSVGADCMFGRISELSHCSSAATDESYAGIMAVWRSGLSSKKVWSPACACSA